MKSFFLALPIAALALAACDTPEQNAVAAGAGGALVGAALSSKSDRTQGALIGAAIGVAGSTLIRPTSNGQCLYRNSAGQQYTAAC